MKVKFSKMDTHSGILLNKCAEFRNEGQFVDVRLKVGKETFPAHRNVLAAYSDYFYAMFADGMKESNQEVIELKDGSISPHVFKVIIDSIYTGDLQINIENVFEILAAADHLQVRNVFQQCCHFLLTEINQSARFDVQMYCRVWTVADRHSLREVKEAAEHKMASLFTDVGEREEFLSNIDADQLLSLLSRDDLNAPSETFVFKSVMQWIKRKKEERMAVASKVIGAVRLGLVDVKVVIEELETEEMQRDPEINKHLQVAMKRHCMPHKFSAEEVKPRSMKTVLAAFCLQERSDNYFADPKAMTYYFDEESKVWKQLLSVPDVGEVISLWRTAKCIRNYCI